MTERVALGPAFGRIIGIGIGIGTGVGVGLGRRLRRLDLGLALGAPANRLYRPFSNDG